MAQTTLPQRFFPLHRPEQVDDFLGRFDWCVIFKAGSGDKTVDAWLVAQRVLEPRVDVAVGFIVLPQDRPASERVRELTGIPHRSPQFVLFERGAARFHLDEGDISPDRLAPQLAAWLPASPGPRLVNPDVVSIAPYRELLVAFIAGELPEARFQWAYLERLQREAPWRDAGSFEILNALFENPGGRDVRPAHIIAVEFQSQLAGRTEPLRTRAERLVAQLATMADPTR